MTVTSCSKALSRAFTLEEWRQCSSLNLCEQALESVFASQSILQTRIVQKLPIEDIIACPEGVERGPWLYELVRQSTIEAGRLTGLILAICKCQIMVSGQKDSDNLVEFLCAAHTIPNQCTAADYCFHTVNRISNDLNEAPEFSQRITMEFEDVQCSLANISRRLLRIFSHCYYSHRKIFMAFENHEVGTPFDAEKLISDHLKSEPGTDEASSDIHLNDNNILNGPASQLVLISSKLWSDKMEHSPLVEIVHNHYNLGIAADLFQSLASNLHFESMEITSDEEEHCPNMHQITDDHISEESTQDSERSSLSPVNIDQILDDEDNNNVE